MSPRHWTVTEYWGILMSLFISQERSHFLPALQVMNLWEMYYITCSYSSVLFRTTEILAFIVGDMLPSTADCGSRSSPLLGCGPNKSPCDIYVTGEKTIRETKISRGLV